jgi:hypothetical protein
MKLAVLAKLAAGIEDLFRLKPIVIGGAGRAPGLFPDLAGEPLDLARAVCSLFCGRSSRLRSGSAASFAGRSVGVPSGFVGARGHQELNKQVPFFAVDGGGLTGPTPGLLDGAVVPRVPRANRLQKTDLGSPVVERHIAVFPETFQQEFFIGSSGIAHTL